jgi:hypothetical protein
MGILGFLSNFKHKAEMRESQDEMLIGELVYRMAKYGWPLIELVSNDDLQVLRFKTVKDPVLYSLRVRLDRKTGTGAVGQAMFGSKATLRVTGEVKNMLADPDDLLNQWSTDIKNVIKIPLLGDIKLNHELNSVYAEKANIIEIQDFIGNGDEGRAKLKALLDATVVELRGALKEFNKAT